MAMTDAQLAAYAEALITAHAKEVEFLSIVECAADSPHVLGDEIDEDDARRVAALIADAVVSVTWPLPEVVTLCGSMRFLPLMLQVAAEETAKGAVVLAPFTVVAPEDQGGEFKAMLDRLHRRKIDMAHRVVVVTDETGYYGASTKAEIAYARSLGLPFSIRAVITPGGPA